MFVALYLVYCCVWEPKAYAYVLPYVWPGGVYVCFAVRSIFENPHITPYLNSFDIELEWISRKKTNLREAEGLACSESGESSHLYKVEFRD